MSVCQSCANNCVPLLARIVLGAAFITAGWGKFQTGTFSGDTLKDLQDMGLADASSNQEATILPTSFSYQDAEEGQDSGDDGASEAGQETGTGDQDDDAAAGGDDEEVVEQPDDDLTAAGGDTSVQMKNLYHIAAMLKGTPVESYAKYLAWGAAITELAGGVLILIGLFSRLWGLGLAVIMATAFYLTSLGPLGEVNYNLFNLSMDGVYQGIFLQLALFVLAFGVFITGPGAFSVDRLLFRGGNGDNDTDIDLT